MSPTHTEETHGLLHRDRACGAAVIGTDVPGIREVIDHGRTVLLCPSEAAALRSAIVRLLGDAALRCRLGESARAHIEATMSLDKIVDLELGAYQAALEQSMKDARLGT